MSKITSLRAREVLDSRGNPTVEVDALCECGSLGRAIVPSGASTGKAEAFELRDGDPDRYDGKGVLKAVENVNERIASQIVGRNPLEQFQIDAVLRGLDPDPRFTDLGANAVLGVSLAVARAAAVAEGIPLWKHLHGLQLEAVRRASAEERTIISSVSTPKSPVGGFSTKPVMPVPMVNMISGGLHAGGKTPFQDFMILPVGADNFRQGLEWCVRVHRRLGEALAERGYESILVAEEGGYGPELKTVHEAAELIMGAIEAARLTPEDDVMLAVDVAGSHFMKDNHYVLPEEDHPLTAEEMIDRLEKLVREFPVACVEDGLAEDDWTGWQALTERLSDRTWLIGDDLFTTNHERIWRGVQVGAANSILVKVNQIGTLTGALKAMAFGQLAEFSCVVSARSGETEDTTIADLAVGSGCGLIKIGCVIRGERLAKYNRLLRIEEELQAAE
ncbi:MAG: phosphopyruvate hydratase [Planctomycetales bacterium]